MRKVLAWITVTLGVAALLRKLRGRRPVEAAPDPAGADPADELRRTLAETRDEDASADAAAEGQSAPEPSVDDRRTAVHEQGRAAIEEMQGSSEPDR